MTKVIAEQFRRYDGRDVIPLKGRTKRPRDNAWTTQRYDGAKVIEKAIEKGTNIGLRLGPTDLVIDVDPRNGGELSFRRLCHDLGIDPFEFPRVNTGSGGLHVFAKLPDGVKIVDTVKAYPGVEFKSKGRQVVAAGSIHPDTGKPYVWDDFFGALEDAPACPPSLLEAIRRPVVDFAATGGGCHTPEECAALLDALDATNFSTNDLWLPLMCAVHHASGGDARQEWIDWSTSDPKFAGHADLIGQRWDSLHAQKPGAITVATLYKALADAGRADMIPKTSRQDDFDDYTELEDNAKKPGKFSAMKLSQLLALPSPKWLIKNLMIEGGLLEIYGRFKSGKTFWAVEMACCIATGFDFQDQPVKQGRVLYVIAEGSRKLFAYRMEIWARERSNGDDAEYKRLKTLVEDNIDVVPVAVKIDVADQVKAFLKENPGERALVVIDTLFRTMTGDVMNAKDFAQYVRGCDLIRRTLKTAVLFLHHQKRNEAKGGFGSVVGEASVDAAMKITSSRKGETVLRLELMRDGDAGAKPWSAKIKVVKIDDPALRADEVGTVGVLQFHARGITEEDVLRGIHDDKPESFADIAGATDTPKTTIQRYVKQLRKRGLIEPDALKLTAAGQRVAINGDDFNDAESDDFEGD